MAIFKTETLKEKGLTQEQIDYIMAEAGKQVNSLTAERDGYKNQLATAQASLKAMEASMQRDSRPKSMNYPSR